MQHYFGTDFKNRAAELCTLPYMLLTVPDRTLLGWQFPCNALVMSLWVTATQTLKETEFLFA